MLFSVFLTTVLISSLSAAVSLPKRGPVASLSGSAQPMSAGGGTYPRATHLLEDDSILAAYTAFSGGQNVLTLAHQSVDSSWSQLGIAATGPSDSNDLDNPFPIQLPSGRVLLTFRNHDFVAGSSPRQYTYYRITVTYSDDQGATWSYLSTPAEQAATSVKNGLWEPFMRIDKNGNLQLYYSEEDADDDQNTMTQTSMDGGQTWSQRVMVTGEGVTARDGMVGIAALNDQLIMVFESVPPEGTFTVNAVTSDDDGASWADRRLVYAPTGDRNNAGAPQIINVGGRLLVSFMTDEDTQLHAWVTGAGAKVVTSSDGQNWNDKLEVFTPQANWPAMIAVDDNSLLYMADKDGVKAQKITLS